MEWDLESCAGYGDLRGLFRIMSSTALIRIMCQSLCMCLGLVCVFLCLYGSGLYVLHASALDACRHVVYMERYVLCTDAMGTGASV